MTDRQLALLCATLLACSKAIAFHASTDSDRLARDANGLLNWLEETK